MKKLVMLVAPLLLAFSVTAFADDKPMAPAAGGDTNMSKPADQGAPKKKGKGDKKKGGKKKGGKKKEDAAAPKAQ